MTTSFDIDETQRSVWERAGLGLGRIISTVIYVYLVIVEIILFLGFILLLLGANPTSGFVDWVYRSMDRAMQPFRGVFSTVELGQMPNEVESVFDTSVLFAMIVYGILALVVSSLVDWLNRRKARWEREDREYRQRQITEQTVAATTATNSPYAPTSTPPAAPTQPPPAPPAT